ncbi:acyl-CoA dehydrogenase family protein [Rhodococcus tukisamuensis]|uniref:Putative acyl-CoA dehydrogenase n=1 Tax=Rhodococcus tukisamuensis TaxID=168276 RepID=A0A1G6VV37_9NOCA|nr:acyl-CoA dehydrogenase family protein [Rhodococcus tukisamuensis]SDD57540.1 putative acyl-CoA dehydrogenase [Rhodococcus tukisamuensis]
MQTHEVFNQSVPLYGHNVADDATLLEGLAREGAEWAIDDVSSLGALAGTEQVQEWGRLANENPPILKPYDRFGHRIDDIEFHPAWHELMSTAVANGMHGAPWSDPRAGSHVARAAKFYVWSNVEAGHTCPISATYASVPALRDTPELAAVYEPLLSNALYEGGLRSPLEKPGLLATMSMTEKQGGSDIRANTTRATLQSDGSYRIVGHKWFTSATMADLFLVLAQTDAGVTCFLVPRVLEDGTRNNVRLMRLKDKLGNRSNPSAEIEYENAIGWRIGEEGRGVPSIIKMVNMTRLDCLIGAASGMRRGVTQAAHHATHRKAFGSHLIDQPLMRNVLADLTVESEAASLLMMRLAGAHDRATLGDEAESRFLRLALAVGKYWVCKRWPAHAAEAMECFGGNGFIEESQMPRLFRESPLNGIWEGSGNVAALDVLRAMAKSPDTVDAFFGEVALAGPEPSIQRAVGELRAQLTNLADAEVLARRVIERMALVLQASLLVRFGNPAVADAFIATRLDGDRGSVYGTLPGGVDFAAILDRVTPQGR